MSNQISPPRGMRDIVPADKVKRDAVLKIICDAYARFGYHAIETPCVEKIERLRSNQGGENESMLFTIMRRGLDDSEPIAPKDAVDLGLRYDLTLPLTRFYSTNQAQLPSVFRALQTGPVWRAERPQKGRFRQFTQCDIDIIGDETYFAEVDLLVSTLGAFEALGMKSKVRLLINDRRTLTDMLAAAGVSAKNATPVFIALDKLHKIGRDAVAAELVQQDLCDTASADALLDALQGDGGANPLVDGFFMVGGTKVSLYDIPAIVAAVGAVVDDVQIVFDPTLVRGMGYYTGTIFEVQHVDFASSVAGGGRYDGVIGKWLGRDVPACGFSIGFERIIDLVDLSGTGTGMRIALAYPKGIDVAQVMQKRAALLKGIIEEGDSPACADGSCAGAVRRDPGQGDPAQVDAAQVDPVRVDVVGVVAAPKKVKASFLEALAAQGYTHVVRQDFDGNWQAPRPLV